MKFRLTERQQKTIARRQSAPPDLDTQPGTVITHHGTEVVIETQAGHWARANPRRTLGALAPGDRIGWVEGEEGKPVVERVLPRHNALIRPDTHGKLKLMAANLDQVLIVLAPVPWMNPNVVENLLIATLDLPAEPLLVLNKIDLMTESSATVAIEENLQLWQALGWRLLRVSARTGEGMATLRAALDDKISMMVGLSGVGKTSLARALTAQAAHAAIAELSTHNQEGQHTTRHSTLFRLDSLPGGLIDAPGVRDFSLNSPDAKAIDRAFPDIMEYAQACRFANCSHNAEPGCAVRAAATDGQLDARRFAHYQTLRAAARQPEKHKS
ncbi:ribosome small subunit-dependent GTPase A [Halothiobacillus sp. DCM-1]|uniref:ribosome small subunit-dependent GTPase A n=1 Tax=Halothiobacillus sp. DCM-1 TaxID=3112558 RepID=UPI00325485EA